MKRMLCIAVVLAVALTVSAAAQMASSDTHQIESLAVTGGGTVCSSTSYQLTCTLAPTTPLTSQSTIASASYKIQPGLVPILYPRTLLGDANRDDRVDAADVVTTVNIVRGLEPVPTNIITFYNTDTNFDLQITEADIDAVADLLLVD